VTWQEKSCIEEGGCEIQLLLLTGADRCELASVAKGIFVVWVKNLVFGNRVV